ncbi:MAG: ankyrin repeat domain-containing protein [Candidatus Cardinium sp.]|nr:ankyrin repeat domain-containing protein [Candidatus Cardinium sp.]
MQAKHMFHPLNFFIEKGHRILFCGIVSFLLIVCNCNNKSQQNNQKQCSNDLHLAASQGNKSRIRNLIKDGAKVNQRDKDGRTPLHLAADKGYKDCITILIESGADVNQKDNADCTPIDLFFSLTKKGSTALHLAAEKGRADCISALIKGGACVAQKSDFFGLAPLHRAVLRNDVNCVTALIKGGADVNQLDNSRATPLDLAMERKYSNCIAILQAKGGKTK